MLNLLSAGGWLILPIILCSIAAVAIIIDKFRQLSLSRVMPGDLYDTVKELITDNKLTLSHLDALADQSPLGSLFSTALSQAHLPKTELKEAIEETGRHQVHLLEKYLSTLGSIAAIAPLLGLLGTVVGMIKVFSAITLIGVDQPQELAGGISQALITTATGLSVAIPSMLFYRYFKSKIETIAIDMERQVLRLLAMIERAQNQSETETEINIKS